MVETSRKLCILLLLVLHGHVTLGPGLERVARLISLSSLFVVLCTGRLSSVYLIFSIIEVLI